MRDETVPDAGVLEILKGYNDTMSISQAVVFFERVGLSVAKTTIQNYVRVGALPPPADKRRYTKNHIIMILMIGHLKEIFSLDEIRLLFKPAADNIFNSDGFGMAEIYRAFCEKYEKKSGDLSAGNGADEAGQFMVNLSAAAESAACRNFLTLGELVE